MNVVSRQEVEQYLDISIERDSYVDRLIEAVSDRLAEYCNRDDWGSTTERTEYADGGTCMVLLGVWPIVSVSAIYDDPCHDWDIGELLDSDSYYAGKNGVIYYEDGYFLNGKENVKVVYVGGYENEAAIPSKIKSAALMQIKNEYLSQQPSVNSQMFENASDEGLLPEVSNLMDPYKRNVPF